MLQEIREIWQTTSVQGFAGQSDRTALRYLVFLRQLKNRYSRHLLKIPFDMLCQPPLKFLIIVITSYDGQWDK